MIAAAPAAIPIHTLGNGRLLGRLMKLWLRFSAETSSSTEELEISSADSLTSNRSLDAFRMVSTFSSISL